ncbi:hypothetical protein EPO17_01950 [Patescibacteria group bacterium]|nr:MAG: hypothetical protein EPO17_01950 [Patescibacteria group bacterium]
MACRLTKTRWKILIGLAVFIDILQIVLDFFAVGLAVNRFIDIAVGIALPFFLRSQGVKLASPKRILTLLATFIGEMIPIVDSLPLWSLDVWFIWGTVKAEEALAKVPGAGMAVEAITNAKGGNTETTNTRRSGPPPLPNNTETTDSSNSPQVPERSMQDIRPRL